MDISLMIRILVFALIPIALWGIASLIKRENEKEGFGNGCKEVVVIRPPKVMGWTAVVGIIFFTALILIMHYFPNGTESPMVFLVFGIFDLLAIWLLWAALVWQIEVFTSEDFIILRDYWGHKHKINYTDCTSYQYRYRHHDILIHNHVKNFTISYSLINYGILIASL